MGCVNHVIYSLRVRTAPEHAIRRLRAWLKGGKRLKLQCIDIVEQGSRAMAIDLNDSEQQRDFTPVPPGIYRLAIKLKPGGGGAGNWLRRSKNLHLQMLEMELSIIGGEHAGRKLWEFAIVAFDDSPDIERAQAERYRTAVQLGRSKLRAILESAREIEPSDTSERAQKARCIDDYGELNRLAFFAWVDVRRGDNGYRDRNALGFIVTPGSVEWANRPSSPPQRGAGPPAILDDGIPF
jgi:hypothetical protein